MARRIFVFDDPDRFVAGAIGPPGQRVFFLQAVEGRRVTSVSLEKVQVALLADRVAAIVAELREREVARVPEDAVRGDDDRPLDEPLQDAFRAGTLTISWDGEESEVTIEARSQQDEDDEEEEASPDDPTDDDDDDVPDDAPDGPDVLRVRLSAAMALGFARRAARIVTAGRPACPFCGQPLNPEGHVCVRSNGYLN